MSSMQIPLISRKYPGLFAIIDEEDYPLVSGYKWYVARGKNTSYAIANRPTGASGPKSIMMHRLIANVPDNIDVDHDDLNGLNNTRRNLRPADATEQNANKGLQRNNTTGYRGVTYVAVSNRWLATINHNRETINLGSYATPEEAARAFDTAAVQLWGEFARLNLPHDFRPVDLDALRLHANNSSGFRGVCFHKRQRKYNAYIAHDKQRINLGSYDDAEDAARAYDEAARRLYGKRAHLNFPDE